MTTAKEFDENAWGHGLAAILPWKGGNGDLKRLYGCWRAPKRGDFIRTHVKSASCFLALLIGFLLATNVFSQDVTVSAEAEPNPLGIDEQLSLIITVTGSGESGRPQIPKIEGLKLMGGPAVSNQFQWVNGQASASQSYTYYFQAEREGSVKIPAISLNLGGKVYKTKEISLKVIRDTGGGQGNMPRRRSPFSIFDDLGLDEDSPLRDRTPRRADVLVIAESDKKNVYVGEQVTLTYKILTQVPITQIEVKESPALNGFWVEEIPTSKNPEARTRVINGKQFAEYVIKKQALFPTSAGTQQIPSSTFGLVVRTSSGGFFSLGSQEAVLRKTEPIAIKVAPLPETGKPAGFNGAVGNFKLESSVDKPTAETGEAVNLKITLSGTGNLKTITDFPLPELPGFKIYSSKSNDNPSFKNDALQGTKTWEYVIIPQAPGQELIPEFKFDYFSPDSRQYRFERAGRLEVAIRKGKGVGTGESSQVAILQQGIVKRGSDINYIKVYSGPLRDRSRHLYQSRWLYGGLMLPALLNGFLLVYINRQARLRQDLIGFRSRRAGKIAEKRLAEAKRCLEKEDLSQFHSILEASITGYLSDKFNLPKIEITSQQVKRFMEERNLNPNLSSEVSSLLEECNFARYAPVAFDRNNLETLFEKARNSIVRIEKEAVSRKG